MTTRTEAALALAEAYLAYDAEASGHDSDEWDKFERCVEAYLTATPDHAARTKPQSDPLVEARRLIAEDRWDTTTMLELLDAAIAQRKEEA